MADGQDLDLGGLDFDLDLDAGQVGGAGQTEDVGFSLDLSDALASGLSIESTGFDGGDFALDLDDGTSMILGMDDAGSADIDLESALSTDVDIVTRFREYQQLAVAARQKLSVMLQPEEVKRDMPTMLDFDFISDMQERQLIYGYFCQMLDDLTTDKRYAGYGVNDAYQLMLSDLFDSMHWTPNVHAEEFYSVFATYYEKNRRLSDVGGKPVENTITQYLSLDEVKRAEQIYTMNSAPFYTLSQFLNNPQRVPKQDRTFNPKQFGHLFSFIVENVGKRSPNSTDAKNGIRMFLMSDSTLRYVGITREQAMEFDMGEIFRRFMVRELEEGTFMPQRIDQFAGMEYSPELLQAVVQIMYVAMQQDSISAEILLTCMMIMQGIGTKEIVTEMLSPLVLGIISYFAVYYDNSAAAHPVLYSYIGDTTNNQGEPAFEIGYQCKGEMYTTVVDNVLCYVVGDGTNSFCVPSIHEDNFQGVVVCPPWEVVHSLFSVTGASRMSIAGNVSYVYRPTYSWLMTLNLASSEPTHQANAEDTDASSLVENTLIQTLHNYTNDFVVDKSADFNVVTVDAPGKCSFMGIQSNDEGTITIGRMTIPGKYKAVTEGLCVKDDDGSLVVRYNDGGINSETVEVIYPHQMEMATFGSSGAGQAKELPEYSDIVSERIPIEGFDNIALLPAVVRQLCERTALDYDAMLEDARRVIAGDLSSILHLSVLDVMVGYRLLQQYYDAMQANNGALDSFNFETLKAIALFTLGSSNPLAHKAAMDAEVPGILQEILNNKPHILMECVVGIDRQNMHIMALQGSSKSDLACECDMQRYRALHYIPEMNARLCSLENQMVLGRAVSEIGEEVVNILRRKSPLYSTYTKVCTSDTVGALEVKLKTGMKYTGEPIPMSATRRVLSNTLLSNFAVLKYFVLEHNMYGILTGLEDLREHGDDSYEDLYNVLRTELPFVQVPRVSELTQMEFNADVTPEIIEHLYEKYSVMLTNLLCDGIVAETASNTNISVVLTYDMLTAYGADLFNLSEADVVDFRDTAEYADDFYSYVGSLLVSYSLVDGEAAGEIDGGADRFSAYVRHRDEFNSFVPLSKFDGFDIHDMRTVVGNEEDEIFKGTVGE